MVMLVDVTAVTVPITSPALFVLRSTSPTDIFVVAFTPSTVMAEVVAALYPLPLLMRTPVISPLSNVMSASEV